MGLYNFQSRFVPFIIAGKKTHTIRAIRVHPDKPGNTLYLYTGLRTKKAKLLMCVDFRGSRQQPLREGPNLMADWDTVRYDPSYEEKLDPEIIPLCDVLNAAGFITTSSCCGHGHNWPHVWFEHSSDERIENMARFVLNAEVGNYRPYFSMFQKEIRLDGYAWSLEIHINDVYSDTAPEEFLRRAKIALAKVTELVQAWMKVRI